MITMGDTTIEGVFFDVLHVPGIAKKIFFVNKTTSLNHFFNLTIT
jgi:hypothetical protein